jgi:hypothetical protein
MIPNPSTLVYTSPADCPSVPPWFAEVVVIVQHLAAKGLLDAFAHQIRLVRGRFGTYEPLDFLALLVGYAISGERTLSDFFERLAPFGSAFMALFGRREPTGYATRHEQASRKRRSIFLGPLVRTGTPIGYGG